MHRATRRRRLTTVCTVVAVAVVWAAGSVAAASPAAAQTPSVTGASIALSPSSVEPGQTVVVSFAGWGASTVNLAVCGNQALRGSADCDMPGSSTIRLDGLSGTSSASLIVDMPKVACPCVVRAVAVDTSESAVAPLDIVGAPTSAASSQPFQLGTTVALSVSSQRADTDLGRRLREAVGGVTLIDLDVTLQNISAIPLDGIVIDGSGGRAVDSADLSFSVTTGPIAPGERWRTTIPVEIPSPAYGTYTWRVTASGTGPPVVAITETRIIPIGLLVVVVILTGLVTTIAVRRIQRWRTNRRRWVEHKRSRGDSDDGGPPASVEDLQVMELV